MKFSAECSELKYKNIIIIYIWIKLKAKKIYLRSLQIKQTGENSVT